MPISKEERIEALTQMRKDAIKTILELEMSIEVMKSETIVAAADAEYTQKLQSAIQQSSLALEGQNKGVRMMEALLQQLQKPSK